MRPIPKIEDYLKETEVDGDQRIDTNDDSFWILKALIGNFREQWAKEAEKIILEYEKEASIRAVIDAESLGGIQQQEGKA